MGAPRRYTDAQRQAIFALHKQGVTAAEISRRCREGLASVDAFEIPRRTVHDICSRMAFEQAWKPPKRLEDFEGSEAFTEFPREALRVVLIEGQRLIRKARQRRLPERDVTRLHKLIKLLIELRNYFATPGFTGTKSQPAGNGSKSSVRTLEQLADKIEADPE